ncbi:MAG: Ppx/GppA family phosphatase [Limisphaerales bacterium]
MQAPDLDIIPPSSPAEECRAVIDIGTNSVKLLIARVGDSRVEPILEKGIQTRLGEGFFTTRRLRPDAMVRTAETVAAFRSEALSHEPRSLRVLATAAAREASNASEFADTLRNRAGVEVEIIDGTLEAELAFLGVCSNPALAGKPLLVADVGGGSTELIVGESGHRRFSRSFPLGAVRLMESIHLGDPPGMGALDRCRASLADWMSEQMSPAVRVALPPPDAGSVEFVGVGGTVAVLASILHGLDRYDRDRIEATRLDSATLARLTERLWTLDLEKRRQIPGLPPERADIILTGCAIYEALMKTFQLGGLRPSTRGIRFGALLHAP